MAERLRCAVIGVGSWGTEHLKSLSTCPRAVVVAIAESNAERAHAASDSFRIPRSYTDYRELLDQPDIDAVTIALPNYLHAPVALESLKARKHVLLEKPMATSVRDAARVIETAKKMKRVIMVAQNFRFNAQSQVAKIFLESGALGEIYHARCFWHRSSGIPRIGSWFTQKQYAGGGCTYDLGVHMLDLTCYLMNDFQVRAVSAQTFSKFGARGLGEANYGLSEIDSKKVFDVEDYCVALLRMESGRTIALEVSWAAYHASDVRERGVDLYGTDAGLSLFPARLFRTGSSGYETIHLAQTKLPYSEDRVHHFVTCVLEGKRPLVSIDESYKIQQVLDAIYASALSGKEVRLK
jgi:predicted dehydrogenase